MASLELTTAVSRLGLAEQRLTIGEPVACRLTLASPPANLTIFGIHVYLRQTVGIRSPSSAETTTVASPKRTILQAGYLDRWAVPDFVARAKREHRSELLFDGTSQSGQKGEVWKWEADGVLVRPPLSSPPLALPTLAREADGLALARPPQPVDNTLKPTTIYYLDVMDGLTFAHQLVFDVYFQQDGAGVKDDRLMIASMCGQDVTVARCVPDGLSPACADPWTDTASAHPLSSSCNFESLTLPQYAEKPSASTSA